MCSIVAESTISIKNNIKSNHQYIYTHTQTPATLLLTIKQVHQK